MQAYKDRIAAVEQYRLERELEVAFDEASRIQAIREAGQERERKREQSFRAKFPDVESFGGFIPTLKELHKTTPAPRSPQSPEVDLSPAKLGNAYLREYFGTVGEGRERQDLNPLPETSRLFVELLEVHSPTAPEACAIAQLLKQIEAGVYKGVILNPTPNSTLAATVARLSVHCGSGKLQDWAQDCTGEVLAKLLEERPKDCASWARMYWQVSGSSILEVVDTIAQLPKAVAQALPGHVRSRSRKIKGYGEEKKAKLGSIIARFGEGRLGKRLGLFPAPRIHSRLYYRSTPGPFSFPETSSARNLQAYGQAIDSGLIRLEIRERETTGTQGVRGWIAYTAKQVALKLVGSYTLSTEEVKELPAEEDLAQQVSLKLGISRQDRDRIAGEVECWARERGLRGNTLKVLLGSILLPDCSPREIAAGIGVNVAGVYKVRKRYLKSCGEFVLQGIVEREREAVG